MFFAADTSCLSGEPTQKSGDIDNDDNKDENNEISKEEDGTTTTQRTLLVCLGNRPAKNGEIETVYTIGLVLSGMAWEKDLADVTSDMYATTAGALRTQVRGKSQIVRLSIARHIIRVEIQRNP